MTPDAITPNMTDYYIWAGICVIIALFVGWFGHRFISGTAKIKEENDRLTATLQKDAKRIIVMEGSIKGHETANAALVNQKATAENALVEMREKAASQDAEIARVDQINEALRADVIAESQKLEKLRHMSIDARLTRITGIGEKVEIALNKQGVRSIYDLSEMEPEALIEAMDAAKVPAKLRNPKAIQKQANALVGKLKKALAD